MVRDVRSAGPDGGSYASRFLKAGVESTSLPPMVTEALLDPHRPSGTCCERD